MELGLATRRFALRCDKTRTPSLILLDTNALLWLQGNHKRSRPLVGWQGRLYISPTSLLEIQFLLEAQRIRLRPGVRVLDLADDPRWLLDEPPAAAWFSVALDLTWTRDPFDRLLIAHSQCRGWRLATGDSELIDRLGINKVLEL
jgi:PIN domain nuclease of toxin-antitoxin system